MFKIFRAPEFIDWFEQQSEKSKVQIDDRLSKIQYEEHLGEIVRSKNNFVSIVQWSRGH